MMSAGSRALNTFTSIQNSATQSLTNTNNVAEQATKTFAKSTEVTDHWTKALGNYNKDALKAVYSTEELVDMGFMTQDALLQSANATDQMTDNVDSLGDALIRTAEEMEELSKQAEKANDDIKKTTKSTEESRQSSDGFGRSSKEAVLGLDDVLATVGIAAALSKIADTFAECSEAAAAFERNVSMISTVADSTVLSADQISDQISALSRFAAKDVNELADATYNAISAGIATENAVTTVGDATMLATAGFTSSSSALSVLTTALNAYGMEAEELTKVSDSLIVSQNLGVMTIDQLSGSMGRAISTASAYSVDLYNLESGYISLTKAGIGVDESTTYLSAMFNELGKAGSNVSDILIEETGMSFGQLMEQGNTLADALDVLYERTNQNSEAFMNLWGSAEAGKAGNAIINQGLETFEKNLSQLTNATGTTQKAYDAMTNTAAFGTERMTNSFANLRIAVGDDLNPVMSVLQNRIADITDNFAKLIDEHPAISGVLSGAAVGIGAITIGITGYIAVTKIASVLTATFGSVMTAVTGPIGMVAATLGILTAGMVAMSTESERGRDALTSTSQGMADELDSLRGQYSSLADAGNADTAAAYELQGRIDKLSNTFDSNKQTIGDLIDANKAYRESLEAMVADHDAAMDKITDKKNKSMSLIAQLDGLMVDGLTGSEIPYATAIVDELNVYYEGLNATVDKLVTMGDKARDAMVYFIESVTGQDITVESTDAIADYLADYQQKYDALEEARKTKEELSKVYFASVDEFNKNHPIIDFTNIFDTYGTFPAGERFFSDSVGKAYDEYMAAVENSRQAADAFNANKNALINSYEQLGLTSAEVDQKMAEALENASKASSELSDQTLEAAAATEKVSDGYSEAGSVIASFGDQLTELATLYDQVYQSAMDSIEGQYSLWDEVANVVKMSKRDINDALQSQLDYWTNYNDNLSELSSRSDALDVAGLEDMLKVLSDGSEGSASMLEGLTNLSNTDLSKVVQKYYELQQAQSETATSIADLETEFSEDINKIKDDMTDMVEKMDMSDLAKLYGKSTIDAYVDEITAGVARAQGAIDSLSFADKTISTGGYHDYANASTYGGVASVLNPTIETNGYAIGTSSASPGLALVGENGPELVNFGGGETVYTAGETSNILSQRTNDNVYVDPGDDPTTENYGSRDKTIILRIEGSGSFDVGGKASREDIVSVITDNIKGVILSLVRQEIAEEGEGAYEF
jgi:TP901 family phage tail tape measure protein